MAKAEDSATETLTDIVAGVETVASDEIAKVAKTTDESGGDETIDPVTTEDGIENLFSPGEDAEAEEETVEKPEGEDESIVGEIEGENGELDDGELDEPEDGETPEAEAPPIESEEEEDELARVKRFLDALKPSDQIPKAKDLRENYGLSTSVLRDVVAKWERDREKASKVDGLEKSVEEFRRAADIRKPEESSIWKERVVAKWVEEVRPLQDRVEELETLEGVKKAPADIIDKDMASLKTRRERREFAETRFHPDDVDEAVEVAGLYRNAVKRRTEREREVHDKFSELRTERTEKVSTVEREEYDRISGDIDAKLGKWSKADELKPVYERVDSIVKASYDEAMTPESQAKARASIRGSLKFAVAAQSYAKSLERENARLKAALKKAGAGTSAGTSGNRRVSGLAPARSRRADPMDRVRAEYEAM